MSALYYSGEFLRTNYVALKTIPPRVSRAIANANPKISGKIFLKFPVILIGIKLY